MKTILLSKGLEGLVDEDDYETVNQYKWFAYRRGRLWYVARNKPRPRTGNGHIYLHHFILGRPPSGKMIDHVDGNGLNNQRDNLRFATSGQNQQNRHFLSTNTSGYRGVTWNKKSNKWQAGIKFQEKSIHLGLFDTPEGAAYAYDMKAVEIFGEFANPNFRKVAA
jgi:hypothetical protein